MFEVDVKKNMTKGRGEGEEEEGTSLGLGFWAVTVCVAAPWHFLNIWETLGAYGPLDLAPCGGLGEPFGPPNLSYPNNYSHAPYSFVVLQFFCEIFLVKMSNKCST